MTVKVVYAYDENKKANKELNRLVGKRFASFVAVARMLDPGQQVYVQQESGNWAGWYYNVGVDKKTPDKYHTSRPLMEY